MKVLFIKLNNTYIKHFAKILIPSNIEFGLTDSYYNALKVIDNNYYNLIVCDIDSTASYNDITSISFLKELKNHSHEHINIAVMTDNTEFSILDTFIENNITGIIYKNKTISDIVKQFYFIINSLPDNTRKYVRVKPAKHEIILTKIYIPNIGLNLIGYVTDLSLKGFAFTINVKNLPDNNFGQYIENIKLILGNNTIDINGNLIVRNDMALILYEKLPKFSEQLLCNYVAEKLVSY